MATDGTFNLSAGFKVIDEDAHCQNANSETVHLPCLLQGQAATTS